MRCHRARPETADCEGLHFSFLLKLLLLGLREGNDLLHIDRPTLQARTAIYVQPKPALDVPLNFLALPALVEPTAHLEADNLVLELHQVVEYRDV